MYYGRIQRFVELIELDFQDFGAVDKLVVVAQLFNMQVYLLPWLIERRFFFRRFIKAFF